MIVEPSPMQMSSEWISSMRLYALVETGDPEAIDLPIREEDAQRPLEECLSDEPR
jgi:hypothetical protein